MGWETRNGRLYYYHKERDGNRVISRYAGKGEVAYTIAEMNRISGEVLETTRTLAKRQQIEAKQQEANCAAYFAEVEAVFRQAMTDAGYHRQKRGEWRKRREQK